MRARFIITTIVTGAPSLVGHFIRPVQSISRRPMSVNTFLAITAQATDFLTGTSQPVDIQVAAGGSLYYLARGTGAVMKIRYTTNSSPVITTQPTSTLVSVGYPVTFSVTASGPLPYSYQWL